MKFINSKRVIIFNEFVIISRALELLVKNNFPDFIIQVVETKVQLIEESQKSYPDLVIIDIFTKEEEDFTIIKGIRNITPSTKILVYSLNSFNNSADLCFRYGASGVLDKNTPENKIIATIKLILFGEDYFQNEVKVKLGAIKFSRKDKNKAGGLILLSKRELEVAKLLVKGESNLAICKKLNLAFTTVSTFKRRIFLKTKTDNIIDLARLFN